jgi:hypothetical protein
MQRITVSIMMRKRDNWGAYYRSVGIATGYGLDDQREREFESR